MKITWINPAPTTIINGGKSSSRVCVRLRSILPGEELTRRGHDIDQVFFGDLPSRLREPLFLHSDAFVFGKAFVNFSPLVHAIRAAGRARILIDICDNVFEPPEDGLKSNYIPILPQADTVVTSSEFLSAALREKIPSSVELLTVPDAVEGEPIDPTFEPRPGIIRLLWFGYPNNLPLLQNELANLRKLIQIAELRLSVVSAWPEQAPLPAVFEGISIRCRQWSLEVMRDELKECDCVIIPSDMTPARLTKSANRMITSIWAGKFVAAHPLPSYQPFEAFAHVHSDIVEGIKWALENREAVRQRIAAGQAFIQEHYSIRTIGDRWQSALRPLVQQLQPERGYQPNTL